ncbi:MAG TPA: methylated-DNA--[protein]-cysteine S-methyltransferase [Paludibaculum sp.]
MTASPIESTVRQLCQYIQQNCQSTLSLAQLARHAGVSPFHLQRNFQSLIGLSPRQFQQACRLQLLKANLRQGAPATDAIFDAGFGSLSRVYETAATCLGMTPAEYRAGGRSLSITYAPWNGPLGLMLLAATDRGLCFLQFGDSPEALLELLRREFPAADLQPMPDPPPTRFTAWMESLAAHLAGRPAPLDLPLHLHATAFQMRVWRYLQTIPRGETRSYSQVAAAIGQPTAARAVARACAANTMAVVIPCHRVIRGTGHLGGYRWGLERKHSLLHAEKPA